MRLKFMKNILLPVVFVTLLAASVFAQPRTVTDYYLAMPSNFYNFVQLKDKTALTNYRRKNIKIEDVKNGYLKIESNDLEGFGEVALFKKNDGSYIIGQTSNGCGPVCGGDVNFWTYRGGQWTNVTKQLFAFSENDLRRLFETRKTEESDRIAYFELPREGRTVKLKCDSCDESGDAVLAEFEWNGTKFIRK